MNAVATQYLLEKYGKKNAPELRSGDTVRIHQKITEGNKERVQIFEGLVIAVKHGKGLDGSYTVRKIGANGIGVERTYPLHSPNVIKVERTKSAEIKRAKLFYMRDRKGKSARFKNEVQNPASWDEAAAVAALAAEMAAAEAEAAELAKESVAAEALEEVAEQHTEVVVADVPAETAAAETTVEESPAEVATEEVATVSADEEVKA